MPSNSSSQTLRYRVPPRLRIMPLMNTTPHAPLQRPMRMGRLELPHRVWMAAMTRSRADDAGCIGPLAPLYYAQRHAAAAIISEGLYPEAGGRGYIHTPGLATAAQAASWRAVTAAVHAKGGRILAQLMHTGRISHPSLLPPGEHPVAPSAIAAAGSVHTAHGEQALPTPRALGTNEVGARVEGFVRAAQAAVACGFDGVQIHAGSGYLPMQFFSPHSNQRQDRYGGSASGRMRFLLDVLQAVSAAIGADRTGVKLTPGNPFNDMVEPDARSFYPALLDAMRPLALSFVEVVPSAATPEAAAQWHRELRPRVPQVYVAGGGLNGAAAARLIDEGLADAVSFGRAFIANPDLPQRLWRGSGLNPADPSSFYGGGARGYTDYPTLNTGDMT
jgi:N-ethylmaleimide reductase